MQISHNGVEALKQYEGFSSTAYKDTGGVWTIGYGSTRLAGVSVQEADQVTAAEAEEQLVQDLAWAQTAVNQLVRVELAQNQFDALVSFVYNIGEEAFRKSTLLRKLNTDDPTASAEFDRWVNDNGKKVQGLVNRRALERKMFEA